MKGSFPPNSKNLNWIKLEVRYFFIAVSFLTRIPIPEWVGFQKDWLDKSIKYSPYVGFLLGAIQFFIFLFLSLFFSPGLSFAISIGVLLIVTGGFHEDGFADFCDGIGGGWKREDILRIMKDSRVGSFGAIGISLLILIKIIGFSDSMQKIQLSEIQLFFWFVTAQSLSRFISLSFMTFLPYAKDEGYAKPMAKEIGITKLLFACIPAIFSWLALSHSYPQFLWSLAFHLLISAYAYRLMKKWIQGFTGDCLGAVQQMNETVTWVSGVFLWNSI